MKAGGYWLLMWRDPVGVLRINHYLGISHPTAAEVVQCAPRAPTTPYFTGPFQAHRPPPIFTGPLPHEEQRPLGQRSSQRAVGVLLRVANAAVRAFPQARSASLH